MKEDEKQFLISVFQRCLNAYTGNFNRCSPRTLINEEGFNMHHKRAWYLLDKWSGKGWYDWGVSLDMGWLTPKGIEIAKELLV